MAKQRKSGKKKTVKEKNGTQPQQPNPPEDLEGSWTSEDSIFRRSPSPEKNTDWCPDAKLRDAIDDFFAAMTRITGNECRFVSSELKPGEAPLRGEYRNLATIKNTAEQLLGATAYENSQRKKTVAAKKEHQANLTAIVQRQSEKLEKLRHSNSRYSTDKKSCEHALEVASVRFELMDFFDLDTSTSSDREDGDPEAKYKNLAGNSLLAKQVVNETAKIEAEMQDLRKRIAYKEKKLSTMSAELRKTREDLKQAEKNHPLKEYLPLVKDLLKFSDDYPI